MTEIELPAGAFMTQDHLYYFNGEGPFPGATTVIGVMDKPAIVVWKARETARAILSHPDDYITGTLDERINRAVKQADESRDTAARLGSSVHLLADMASRGHQTQQEGFEIGEGTQPYLAAFRGFLERYSASNIVSSEKAVWSWAGYAGTYDLLMTIDGELWILDIKTSKGYYPEYALQLAAYAYADAIILPKDPNPYPMPKVSRYGVLHLRPDLYVEGWRLIEYPVTDKDYIAFLGALELYRWKKEGRFTKSILNAKSTSETPSKPLADPLTLETSSV